MPNESWQEYSKHVILSIDRLTELCELNRDDREKGERSIRDQIYRLETKLEGLQVRIATWSLIGGAICTVILNFIVNKIKF